MWLRNASGEGVKFTGLRFDSKESDVFDWDIRRRCDSAENLIGLNSLKKGFGHDTSGFRDWELFLMFR